MKILLFSELGGKTYFPFFILSQYSIEFTYSRLEMTVTVIGDLRKVYH